MLENIYELEKQSGVGVEKRRKRECDSIRAQAKTAHEEILNNKMGHESRRHRTMRILSKTVPAGTRINR